MIGKLAKEGMAAQIAGTTLAPVDAKYQAEGAVDGGAMEGGNASASSDKNAVAKQYSMAAGAQRTNTNLGSGGAGGPGPAAGEDLN